MRTARCRVAVSDGPCSAVTFRRKVFSLGAWIADVVLPASWSQDRDEGIVQMVGRSIISVPLILIFPHPDHAFVKARYLAIDRFGLDVGPGTSPSDAMWSLPVRTISIAIKTSET